jgi:hypothetical protein
VAADSSECQEIAEGGDSPVQANAQVACPNAHCSCPKRFSCCGFGVAFIDPVLIPSLRILFRHFDQNEERRLI